MKKPKGKPHTKKRTAGFLPPSVNLSAAAQALGSKSRKKLREDILRPLQEDNVYGHILQKMPLVLSKGEPYQWEYVNPFALVYQYSCLRPRFGDMLKAAANEAGFARIIFYMDEATPGNVLRPDAGRTLACFYWSFMELPSWFRSRQCGWFFFGMFPLALVEHLPGGYASLFTSMVKTFFGKALLQWDFSVSGIACRSTGGGFLFKARFGALLSDEKAMKELWCTKGASSYKPCHLCKNVMGRLDVPPEHPYLVHYTCVDAAQFDLHTPETFREMARQLQEAYTAMSQKRFEKLEQCYGLKYVPLGVLWCEELQDICDPVSHTYWDWMHILMASGGIAQYSFNQYIRCLCKAGITLQTLDAFAAEIVWPKGVFWSKKYFQKRVVSEDGAHLKAFASELFQVMDILTLFIQLVVARAGILQRETECVERMVKIITILSSQEAALSRLDVLEHEIAKHHVLFLALWPDCNKPKTHWLRHVPTHLKAFRCNLSCFAPERKHKMVKQLATAVSANVEKGTLYRAAAANMTAFATEESVLLPVYLEKPKVLDAQWVRAFVPDMQEAYGSKSLRFEGGRLQISDLVWFPSSKQLVEASLFLQIRALHSSQFFIQGFLYEPLGHENLYKSTKDAQLFSCTADMASVPYCKRQGGICPCARLARVT